MSCDQKNLNVLVPHYFLSFWLQNSSYFSRPWSPDLKVKTSNSDQAKWWLYWFCSFLKASLFDEPYFLLNFMFPHAVFLMMKLGWDLVDRSHLFFPLFIHASLIPPTKNPTVTHFTETSNLTRKKHWIACHQINSSISIKGAKSEHHWRMKMLILFIHLAPLYVREFQGWKYLVRGVLIILRNGSKYAQNFCERRHQFPRKISCVFITGDKLKSNCFNVMLMRRRDAILTSWTLRVETKKSISWRI